jgi:hypothetical protein
MFRSLTAAVLLLCVAVPAAAQNPVVEPGAFVAASDDGTGHLDIALQRGEPGTALTVHASYVLPPHVAEATLARVDDPYAASAGRWAAIIPAKIPGSTPPDNPIDTLAMAVVRDPSGTAELRMGVDTDGDGQPSPGEERCHHVATDAFAVCALPVTAAEPAPHWALVTTPRDGATPVEVFTGPLWVTKDAGGTRATVSAPGVVDANGSARLRLGYRAEQTAPGAVAFTSVRTMILGVGEVIVPVVVTRDGTAAPAISMKEGSGVVTLAPGDAARQIVYDAPYGTLSVTLAIRHPVNKLASLAVWHDPDPDDGGPAIPLSPPLGTPGMPVLQTQNGSAVFRFEDVTGTTLGGRWYLIPINRDDEPLPFEISTSAGQVVQTETFPIVAGSYYDPSRPGHGLFVYPAGDEWVVLWYAYDHDGTATWFYTQGEEVDDGDHRLHLPLYRTAWRDGAQRHYPIGDIAINGVAPGEFAMTWTIDGRAGSSRFVPFLTGCPTVEGAPLDASGHWFDPVRAGTGYSVQVAANYEFIAAFLYDAIGRPRFLAAERGGAFDASANAIELHQLHGFGPLAPWQAPVRTPVGTLDRVYTGGALAAVGIDADFADGVDGSWTVLDDVTPLTATQGCAP